MAPLRQHASAQSRRNGPARRLIDPRRRVLRVPGSQVTRIVKLEESPFTNPMSPEEREAAARLHTSSGGTHPFNGGAVRLDAVEGDGHGGLELTISRVEFFDFLSTNYARTERRSRTTGKKRRERVTCRDILADRSLANIIAVSLVIEDSEGVIGIAKRSKGVHVSSGSYCATVTGSLDHADFQESDPFAQCTRREALEELNLVVPEPHLDGLVISRQKLQPVLMYSAVLDAPWREGVARISEAADLCRETDALVAVPLEQCVHFISQNDVTDVAGYQLWAYALKRGLAPPWRVSTLRAPSVVPDVLIGCD